MPLALTVGLFVFGVFIVLGTAGYLIEKNTEHHERKRDFNA